MPTTDPDGLYLNGVLVASPDGIATTYQSNDLTKPTSLQISHSNTFHLPDSQLMRRLTGNAEQLDSGSPDPYRTIVSRLVQSGEVIFSGIAEFDNFSAGWDVTLYEADRDLYDRLDRSIRTADLSRYDHPWTLDSINAFAGAKQGICYPIVDNGLLTGGVLPVDSITPAIYLKTVLLQMLAEENYRLVGNRIADPIYNGTVIAFVDQDPTSYDQQWQDDRRARVTLATADQSVNRNVFDAGSFIDRIQPFNIVDRPDDGFTQGKLKNYNPATYSYVCDTAMRLRVEATQIFKLSNLTGSVEVILSVEKNGQTIASEEFSSGSGYNLLNLRPDKLSLDAFIPCAKNDRVQLRLIVRRQTKAGAFSVTVYNNPDSCEASFTPDLTTQFGDNWQVSRNLPAEITGLLLLKTIAYACCGTWQVNSFKREIQFVSFSGVIANIANKVDWSAKVNTGAEPSWKPRLSPYGQINRLKWKETDETANLPVTIIKARSGTTTPYGDGLILVNGTALESDITLFEMPFAASTLSENEIPGYGTPILIRRRTIKGTGDNRSIDRQSTEPRLILAKSGASQDVNTTFIADDGVTETKAIVRLTPAWFGPRPVSVLSSDTAYSLSFSPVPNQRGEQCLIDRYYDGLLRVLRRMRVLQIEVMLTESDIAQLDFKKPILLQRLQIGSLVLSQQLYYLNKVEEYQPGMCCRITLIAF